MVYYAIGNSTNFPEMSRLPAGVLLFGARPVAEAIRPGRRQSARLHVRFRSPVSLPESTLTEFRASVDSKRLARILTLLESTFTKNRGVDRRSGMGTAGRKTWNGYGGEGTLCLYTSLSHYLFASRAFPLVFAT